MCFFFNAYIEKGVEECEEVRMPVLTDWGGGLSTAGRVGGWTGPRGLDALPCG